MTAKTLCLAAAAATMLHSTAAFTVGPATLPGSSRPLSASCFASRSRQTPVITTRVSKSGVVKLRAKEWVTAATHHTKWK